MWVGGLGFFISNNTKIRILLGTAKFFALFFQLFLDRLKAGTTRRKQGFHIPIYTTSWNSQAISSIFSPVIFFAKALCVPFLFVYWYMITCPWTRGALFPASWRYKDTVHARCGCCFIYQYKKKFGTRNRKEIKKPPTFQSVVLKRLGSRLVFHKVESSICNTLSSLGCVVPTPTGAVS